MAATNESTWEYVFVGVPRDIDCSVFTRMTFDSLLRVGVEQLPYPVITLFGEIFYKTGEFLFWKIEINVILTYLGCLCASAMNLMAL